MKKNEVTVKDIIKEFFIMALVLFAILSFLFGLCLLGYYLLNLSVWAGIAYIGLIACFLVSGTMLYNEYN